MPGRPRRGARTADAGPAVPRRRLGNELRRLREAAGLKIEHVATALECSVSKVSRLENGKAIPRARDVRDLLDQYGVTDVDERDRVMRWVREGQGQGWWSEYSDVLLADPAEPLMPKQIARYVALETEARRIESFMPTVVHPLLQTEAYARQILQTLSNDSDARAVERLLEIQRRRQQRLYDPDEPLQLSVVLDESVLHRPVGGPEVLAGQLRQLLDDGGRDNIDIRVLPLSIGAHRAVAGSFVLLDYPETDDHDVVYLESHIGDAYLDKTDEVATYGALFGSLTNQALDRDATAELVGQRIARLPAETTAGNEA